jgi:uroporphyrinogen III methyltransferase/synthase
VVRLQGGDPLLFGRGGEEIEELKKNGVAFEVVPGLSAASAVPADFGIPLTHRDCASQVHIVTAHGRQDDEAGRAINWKALALAGGTLVFFMGVSSAGEIAKNLVAAGMSPETPAAILERGTTARQKKIITTLDRIAAEAEARSFAPPALILVGGVCRYSDTLSWYEDKPLSNLCIGVTRPTNRSKILSTMLAELGAEVIQIPVIETREIPETPELRRVLEEIAAKTSGIPEASGAPAGVLSRDWFVFTSPAGADIFFEKLKSYHIDIRRLAFAKFAAIGSKTALELENRGILVDLVPGHFSGQDLSVDLLKTVQKGSRVILPRSRIGSDLVVNELSKAGIECIDIPIYDTVTAPFTGGRDPAFWEHLYAGLDCGVFTSGSTVEGFASLFGKEKLAGLKAFCIGRETAAVAQRYGAEVFIAENATMDSIVETIINAKKEGLI